MLKSFPEFSFNNNAIIVCDVTYGNYDVSNVVMMLMMGVLAGVKHISNLYVIRHDSVIRKLFNWDKFSFAYFVSR